VQRLLTGRPARASSAHNSVKYCGGVNPETAPVFTARLAKPGLSTSVSLPCRASRSPAAGSRRIWEKYKSVRKVGLPVPLVVTPILALFGTDPSNLVVLRLAYTGRRGDASEPLVSETSVPTDLASRNRSSRVSIWSESWRRSPSNFWNAFSSSLLSRSRPALSARAKRSCAASLQSRYFCFASRRARSISRSTLSIVMVMKANPFGQG
jgi:hypothetical protein